MEGWVGGWVDGVNKGLCALLLFWLLLRVEQVIPAWTASRGWEWVALMNEQHMHGIDRRESLAARTQCPPYWGVGHSHNLSCFQSCLCFHRVWEAHTVVRKWTCCLVPNIVWDW